MRVLFTVFAAKAHFYNLVPMAWALRAAGHEVRVASQPDLMDVITRTGLTGVPVGEALNLSKSFTSASSSDGESEGGGPWQRLSGVTESRDEMLDWNYVLGTYTIGCSMEYEHMAGLPMLDDLVDHCRDWQPDLVIWDALTFVGPIAALSCGAAHARMLFGVDYNARMWATYRRLIGSRPPEQRDDPVGDWLTGRLARYGMEYDPASATELMTGQWTIDPTPTWMQLPPQVPRLPVRYLPYNGPTSVPDWFQEERKLPRVCLSLGVSARDLLGGDKVSIGGGGGGDARESAAITVADLIGTLAELDIELVATVSEDQLASPSDLPENVRAVEFVPLNELLPTCAAIIHHGGFGTVGNVLTHGVPSVTIPAPWWDEEDLGRSLSARGAGIFIAPDELTLDGLRESVARLIEEPEFLRNSLGVRDELLATPGPRDVVPELEELTRRHRSRAARAST
ncbi:activator-dependent family glycosyltransferase [Streptomyces sp. NPDC058155]|uniref:activator-dependent family glycosyltransferase n=1 Tax=Streptomyces sp. NPDC058155 TaxID=3346359 RepID=UPI0036ECA300